jgi:acyl carrier protein
MRDQVIDVIIRTFGLSSDRDAKSLRREAVSQWDSLGHMQLIPELEKTFHIRFPVYMIAELVDVDSIVHAIQKQKANG